MNRIIIFFISILSFTSNAQQADGPNKLYPILFNYARDLYQSYSEIPFERKIILEEIANYIIGSQQLSQEARVLFIETDHATRSVMAHVWAKAAAYYYGINHVKIFSGGISNASISRNAILALEKAGFIVYKIKSGNNPEYEIKYSFNIDPIILKSTKYNEETNPNVNFGSIILCSNADINLPTVKGNDFRTSLYYFDPTAYDGTSEALDMYLERSKEIATEMFYLFYFIKNSKKF
jgi:arsenate reductase